MRSVLWYGLIIAAGSGTVTLAWIFARTWVLIEEVLDEWQAERHRHT